MADPVTANKSLAQPIRGTDVGVWDVPMNANAGIIDNSFGGVATIALGNSPVTLSSAQYQCAFLRFTGAITSNIAITLPPIGSFYTVINDTTNSSAFYLTMTTSLSGRVIGIPPGGNSDIMTDGTNVRFRNLPAAGSYWDHAGSSLPAWVSACTIPPWLYCNGTTFSSATYPVLANVLGSTTLPDFRGRMSFNLNDGSSRLQSSVAGIDGNTLFATGGVQTVTLSSQNLPSMTFQTSDVGHTHTVTHNANTGSLSPEQFGGSPIGAPTPATITINSNVTGISVNSGGSGTPISIIQPVAVTGIRLVRAA